LDINANTLPRKRIVNRKFPKEHKPFIIVYPRGNYTYKMKNKVVLGAHHTIDDLLKVVSDNIPDTILPIMSEQLEAKILDSLHENKLAVVIFHDQEEVSMGLRKLALDPFYRKHLNFYQIVYPPQQRMKELGISKLAKLMVFLPNPILLIEPDSQEPIEKLDYEQNFIFDKLQGFLEGVVMQHAQYLRQYPIAKEKGQVEQLCLKPVDVRGRFANPPPRYCLMLLLEGSKENRAETLDERNHDLMVLAKKGGPKLSVFGVDLECLPGAREALRHSEGLGIVIYDREKNMALRAGNVYSALAILDKIEKKSVDPRLWRPARLDFGQTLCINSSDPDL